MDTGVVRQRLDVIASLYPEAHCELHHTNVFELTIAVLLSAQCTDRTVNAVTHGLFARYRTPADYIAIPLVQLEQDIQRIGLYRNKAKHIQQLCHLLLTQYDGQIPATREQLMQLPGVGRKTANVILSTGFRIPAIAVDTHVERVSKRLGIAHADDSVWRVEQRLMHHVPQEQWGVTHHRLVLFGRYRCKARQPQCPDCPLHRDCDEGQRRMGSHPVSP